MAPTADVKSISAVREFRTDVLEFQAGLRQSLELMANEVHRGIQWLESDRSAYWPAQVRKASDRVSEARINLERCMLATRPDERRSCYDEKKALERAIRRLAYAEQKVRTTQHWLRVVRDQADDFRSRLARLEQLVEYDLPRATALLERLARSLDKYVGHGAQGGGRPDRPVEPDVDGLLVEMDEGPERPGSEPSPVDAGPPSPGEPEP